MSFFEKSRNVLISESHFTNNNSITWKKDILRDHIAPGAFHNSSERYDPPKCHPQTRVAVIQSIIDWIENGEKTSFIMWLYGPAGAGKSAIAQEIAALCHKSRRLAASFFWSRSVADRNNEKRLIATLVYQLISVIPQIRSHVEEAFENNPSLFFRSLEAQMESLIIEPLERVFGHGQQGVNSGHPRLIILDGLDECSTPETQKYILKVISHSVLKFSIPLCFLIASRPEQAIRGSFNDQPLLAITAQLVLDEKYHPDDDIKFFLVESFKSVKSTHELRLLLPRIWPTDNDINQLICKSSGQFTYAATVVKFVKSPHRRPDKQLDAILGIAAIGNDAPFAELDALYHQIFGFVEDIPRALDILSVFFLGYDGKGYELTVSQIETVLSYPPGDLQLILIDLHSVVNVPPIRDNNLEDVELEECIYVFHASLPDFLMDPDRSGPLYIDKGKANARIAQHFLRYIRNYSPHQGDFYSRNTYIFETLTDHCLASSATRELLEDFFNFDVEKWASHLFVDGNRLGSIVFRYFHVVVLYNWIQDQEANVQNYFGPGRSLLFHSWNTAIDLVCEQFCCHLLEEHPKIFQHTVTALTYPQIFHHCDAFRKVMGTPLDSEEWSLSLTGVERMIEFQKYLCDPERAGRYFVHGGMFAALSVHIFKVVFTLHGFKNNLQEDGGIEMSNEWDDGMPEFDDYKDKPGNEDVLTFAISTLPFYLSNADYTPKLAKHANYLLSHKNGEMQMAEIKLLIEAINVYLKKGPPTIREQFQKPASGSQVINPESDKSSDALSEPCFLAEERRRNSGESLDSNMSLSSPLMSLPCKRLKIMDLLNPAT